MGVHGLWKLIEPSGQMVPLESLAGKVLAVDISIWLHQAVKGMHDAQGAPMAVAHLLILFHRLCKLLFYKIKPVFVFDGGVPLLKTQTMATRRQRSSAAKSEALKVREKLIKNLLKHEAVRQVLSNETASAALGLNSFTLPGPSVEEDLYKLPPIAADYVDSECSEEEVSTDDEKTKKHALDIHSIDVTSQEFLSLPAEVRHEILTELIETRKQSSWKCLDSMPKQSDNFSDFQMSRLLKRHAVQTSLEKAGKEMGGRALSLKELEALLGDQGVLDPKIDLQSRRIAQDSVTRYMLVQKNAEPISKKFDVTEHLEDVGWSSESDTDVILEKRKKEVTDSESFEAKNKNSVSKQDGQVRKEVTDILSILEGTDATDIKVEEKDSQNDSDMKSASSRSKDPTGNNEDTVNVINNSVSVQENSTVLPSKPPMNNPTENSLVSEHYEKKTENINVDIKTISEKRSEIEIEQVPQLGISESKRTNESSEISKEELRKNIEEPTVLHCDLENKKIVENLNDIVVEEREKETESEFKLAPDSYVDLEKFKTDERTALDVENMSEAQFQSKVGEIPFSCSNSERKKIAENTNITTLMEIEPTSDSTKKELIQGNMEMKKEFETQIEQISDSSSNFLNKKTADMETLEKNGENELNPMTDSSSDSESDFIPITSSEMESILPQTTEKVVEHDPPTCAKSDSVMVVINPSEVPQKDDLFADVFAQTKPNENEEVDKNEFPANVSVEELGKALEQEHSHLMQEKGKQERHAMNLTDQIYTDAQELLRLFGVPFVVAPMEAEAQCATLNDLGLTEGTITDDSDIWLFGGRVVYKNFFNQNKHVLEYRSENIERNFKLTREEMIKMALLVGSDYTVGLSGIGPVTALEIIAAFQSSSRGALESLHRFRDWFMGTAKGDPPRTALRKKIKNTVMTPGFPSRAVVEAYLHPVVDDSKEPFSWAKPNLDLIREYVRTKMGWSKEKCNDLLQPVMKKLEEKNSQTTIEKHFRFAQKPGVTEGMLSKRVENAIKRLGNSSVDSDEPADDERPKKKRMTTRKNNANSVRQDSNSGGTEKKSADEEDSKFVKKQKTSNTNSSAKEEAAKLKLIKDRLHRNVKVPQKEMAQKALEDKKKEAIRIFRTFGKPGKTKRKVFAKEEANLSESSSDD